MKKYILMAGLMMSCAASHAQNWGITGGFNSSTLLTNYEDFDRVPGFNVGLSFRHNFADYKKGNPFLDVAVLYSREGYKSTKEDVDIWTKMFGNYVENAIVDVKTHNIKAPINFGYNFHLGEVIGLAPKAGFYMKNILGVDGVDAAFSGGFTAGMNVNLGRRFALSAGYEWDCINSTPTSYDVAMGRNLYANLAYYIF